MSIARSYADAALEQGRQVVDRAQARFTEVRGDAAGLAGKAGSVAEKLTGRVEDRTQDFADKASEAYAELRVRAEALYAELKKNEQAAKVLGVAETAAGVVVETLNERVVTPVRSLLDREPATTVAPAEAPAAPVGKTATSQAATTGAATSRAATSQAATTGAATSRAATSRAATTGAATTKPAAKATPAKPAPKRTQTRRSTKA